MGIRSSARPRAVEGTRSGWRHDTVAARPRSLGRPAAAARGLALAIGLAGNAPAGAAPLSDAEVTARVVAAIEAVCGVEGDAIDPVAAAIGGALELAREPIDARGTVVGQRHTLMRPDGGRVRVERFDLGGQLRRVVASWADAASHASRPRVVAVADERCRVVSGRRVVYGPDGDVRVLEELSGNDLGEVVAREPLDAPVPPGSDPGGVRVAVVDSGVNYLLDPIHRRLARTADGTIVGYDFWDMDRRPFDAHPARSIFYPQRHGTRTASLIAAEAPVASLVPYRYPRGAMDRMRALVEAAAKADVRVVNLSLGSDDRADWSAFEAAARAHPDLLFVASAGNDGRDIDAHPVWPASLDLENLLVVTSSDGSGLPARGSNWGRRTVDVAVPAEDVLATGFHGRPIAVSGSSYAAARITAMVACLASAHPQWRAAELKSAVLARAEKPVDDTLAYLGSGVISDPTDVERGECPGEPQTIAAAPRIRWGADVLYADGELPAHTHALRPTLYALAGAGWDPLDVWRATRVLARTLAQCAVAVPEATLTWIEAPRRARILHAVWSETLARSVPPPRPAAFFIEDTARETPFDAEAFARSNARGRRALVGTVWITRALAHPGLGLAHEMVHAISDSGSHADDPDNLMHERTSGRNDALEPWQCERLRRVGEAFGMLEPVEQE